MTQIICRVDALNKPIVFFADSYHDGKIQAWIPEKNKKQTLGIDEYHATKPLSPDDREYLKRQYIEKTHDINTTVRTKLPRQYERVFTKSDIEIPQSMQAEANEQDGNVERRIEQRRKEGKPSVEELAMRIAEIIHPLI